MPTAWTPQRSCGPALSSCPQPQPGWSSVRWARHRCCGWGSVWDISKANGVRKERACLRCAPQLGMAIPSESYAQPTNSPTWRLVSPLASSCVLHPSPPIKYQLINLTTAQQTNNQTNKLSNNPPQRTASRPLRQQQPCRSRAGPGLPSQSPPSPSAPPPQPCGP